MKTPLDFWCLNFPTRKMEPFIHILQVYRVTSEMISHVFSIVPKHSCQTELASFPSHLHFMNKETKAQEAFPSLCGYKSVR